MLVIERRESGSADYRCADDRRTFHDDDHRFAGDGASYDRRADHDGTTADHDGTIGDDGCAYDDNRAHHDGGHSDRSR